MPIVALSQPAAPETRSDHRPQLSDLRESGALEQDADVVMFIYRSDQYRDDDGQPNQKRRAWPRSSSASSATDRPAPPSWRSSKSSRGSRTLPTDRHDPADRRPRRSRRDPWQLPSDFRVSRVRRPSGARPRRRRQANAYGHGAPQVAARSRMPAPPCLPARISRRRSCAAGGGPGADPGVWRAQCQQPRRRLRP